MTEQYVWVEAIEEGTGRLVASSVRMPEWRAIHLAERWRRHPDLVVRVRPGWAPTGAPAWPPGFPIVPSA